MYNNLLHTDIPGTFLFNRKKANGRLKNSVIILMRLKCSLIFQCSY